MPASVRPARTDRPPILSRTQSLRRRRAAPPSAPRGTPQRARSTPALARPPQADVWPSIVSLNVYSPLALMCALPDYIDQHFNCFSIRLRAATHLVVGLTKDEADVVVDQLALRRFLCEAFVNAPLSNQSTFRQPIPSMKDLLAHQTDAASLPEGRIGWVLKSRRANLAALEAFAAATPRRNAAAEKAAAERMAAVAEASVAK